jgi:Ca2+-transporting ATPase
MPIATQVINENHEWHRLPVQDVLVQLNTDDARGLDEGDAATRLRHYGHNVIEGDKPPGFLKLIAHQLRDFMIGLLLVAAVISGLVGDLVDTLAIIVIVILNAAIGVIQEYRAQRAVAALRDMSAPTASVLRDGIATRIAAADVVPGDIVILEAGDVVPADLRLIEATGLGVDESALTGESVPVTKSVDPLTAADAGLPDQVNMAFKSTLVTRGRGTGACTVTGGQTAIGRIAALLRVDRAVRTPLQARLALFSRRIALAVIAICTLVFVTGLMRGQPTLLMFMTALSLAVAAVPEALPAVITVALGIGARRLGELNSLVRRLPAVESLGSVNYICADKTGTLTENRMTVGALLTANGRRESLGDGMPDELALRLGQAMLLCGDVIVEEDGLKGDPTERALVAAALDAGFDKQEIDAEFPRIAELPFESGRQAMVTRHRNDSGVVSFLKGAPERVIAACREQMAADGTSTALPTDALADAEQLAAQGFRVLAFAFRREATVDPDIDDGVLDGDWMLLGLVGLIDPPRREVGQAIAECRTAGIVPVMITGDHPATAMAIARQIGICDDEESMLTGRELAALSDRDFARRVEDIRVYARVDPEQKIRIVNALQEKGHFVAMTGDGVNDAPALKQATIGIAMGDRGTEVAREAAEIVLLDDSFATIVHAVHEGRRIFDDIRKFVRYTMTSNSGEIWVLVLAPFLGLPLPLLPLHILWINLVTDGFPGLALSAEPAERDTMSRPPRAADEGIFTRPMAYHIFWIGLAIGALTLLTQAWTLSAGTAHWQTMVFTVLVVAQLFHSLAIRSERDSLLTIGLFSNPALVAAIALTIAAQLAVIYVPALNEIFRTAPLTAVELVICFATGAVVLVLVEMEKLVRRLAERNASA